MIRHFSEQYTRTCYRAHSATVIHGSSSCVPLSCCLWNVLRDVFSLLFRIDHMQAHNSSHDMLQPVDLLSRDLWWRLGHRDKTTRSREAEAENFERKMWVMDGYIFWLVKRILVEYVKMCYIKDVFTYLQSIDWHLYNRVREVLWQIM